MAPSTLRGLIVAIAVAGMLGMTIGLTMPLTAVVLDRNGVAGTLIGINAAAQFVGIMAGAPLGPRLVPRFGLLPVMAGALAASAATLAVMPVVTAYPAWLVLRFVFGAAEGVLFVATETWVNQAVSNAVRGRVVSLYTTSLASGFALGPLLIGITGTEGALPFLVGAGVLTGGLAILMLGIGTAPRIAGALSFTFTGYMAALPVAVCAAGLFGLADGGLIAMLAVYGLGLGFGEAKAASLVTALVAGGVVLMIPIGWLIDKVDKRRFVVGCAGSITLLTASIPMLAFRAEALYPALFLLGGLLGSLWLVSMALLGERFRGSDLAAANVGLTFAYGTGSLVGPAVAGAALEAWPPHGMMPALAVCVGIFAVYSAVTKRRPTATVGG